MLVTARLRVTTWVPQDLPELHALHADPSTMRFMRSGIEDEAQTRDRLAGYLVEQAERGWTKWRLEDRTGALVGRAGFRMSDDRAHREIGYLFGRPAWGRGLGTEVVAALVVWHRDHLGPGVEPDLHAYAFVDNAASRRVLEKTGFALVDERLDRGSLVAFYRLLPADHAPGPGGGDSRPQHGE